jgi:hypothetical protein
MLREGLTVPDGLSLAKADAVTAGLPLADWVALIVVLGSVLMLLLPVALMVADCEVLARALAVGPGLPVGLAVALGELLWLIL